jgi:hypothetical protein
MKKHGFLALTAFLPFLLAVSLAAVQYLVTGVTTARTDSNRGVDNWIMAPDAGIDCTGNKDAGVAFQAAINAMPDAGTIKFPIGCKVKMGTGVTSGQCALTIADRIGVQFISDVLVGNFGGGATPQIQWVGSGGTAFCFNHTDHPRIIGLSMQVSGAGNYDSCIVFDGNPVGHIGTAGVIDYFVCNNGANTNANFIGVSISPTAGNNQENYEISHSYFGCSGSGASNRGRDGVITSGSPNLSSVGAAFVPGDAGKPITISYAGGILQTTILSVTDATHIVMNANAAATNTHVSIQTGQSYGIGLQNGASQNALQQTFSRITYSNCHIGIRLAGGNAELNHINGGYSDTGILVGGFVAEQVSINWYESEQDLRGIESTGPLLSINNSRMSNGNQLADGFFKFGGKVNLQNTFNEFAAPANGVLIGQGASNVTLTSISNNFGANDWTAVGYSLILTPPVTSINDGIPAAPGQNMFGCWNSPNACLLVNNDVGHAGGTGLEILSSNFYADVTTPVIGLQMVGAFGIVGNYTAIQTAAGSGTVTKPNIPLQSSPASTPASSSAACATGTIQWDSSFVYVCVATNTWKRATLVTF